VRGVSAVLAIALLAAVIAGAAASHPSGAFQTPQTGAEWRAFDGTWSATGQRHILPTETGQPAVTAQLSGAVLLSAGDGLSRGFRGEAFGFDDGSGRTVGRAVWTDERGDQIFSQWTGERLASGRHISGTITGGTGRYAGITGEYGFAWQYLITTEGGTIQGRAVGLRGRVRSGGPGR